MTIQSETEKPRSSWINQVEEEKSGAEKPPAPIAKINGKKVKKKYNGKKVKRNKNVKKLKQTKKKVKMVRKSEIDAQKTSMSATKDPLCQKYNLREYDVINLHHVHMRNLPDTFVPKEIKASDEMSLEEKLALDHYQYMVWMMPPITCWEGYLFEDPRKNSRDDSNEKSKIQKNIGNDGDKKTRTQKNKKDDGDKKTETQKNSRDDGNKKIEAQKKGRDDGDRKTKTQKKSRDDGDKKTETQKESGSHVRKKPGEIFSSSSALRKYVPPRMRAGWSVTWSSMPTRRATRDKQATIRVTNLSKDVKEFDLQKLFKPFGLIQRIYLAKNKCTQQLKGFAFIEYYDRTDAAKAICSLCGYGYDHLILNVEWAKPLVEN